MATTLGEVLRDARNKKNWTLREVEERTGIHNAHLSQIESGAITRPAPNLLFTLSSEYDLPYEQLMQLAGHLKATSKREPRRSLQGAALHALEELTPREQRRALEYMKTLRRERTAGG